MAISRKQIYSWLFSERHVHGNGCVVSEENGAIDNDDVLVRPVRGGRDPDVSPDLIVCMVEPILDRLVSRFEAVPVSVPGAALYRVWEARPGPDEPPLVTLAGPFLGAPHAVLGLEKMIALGARRIWVTGWCGSLQPDLGIGELVMPLDAHSEEGTSWHYPLHGHTPVADEGMRGVIASALSGREVKARTGRVWTTDAPYRETRHKVRAFRDEGLVAVEMELSALLTVSAFRGVRLACLLVVSDELAGLTWRPGFRSPRLREGEAAVAEVLKGAVLSVLDNDASH